MYNEVGGGGSYRSTNPALLLYSFSTPKKEENKVMNDKERREKNIISDIQARKGKRAWSSLSSSFLLLLFSKSHFTHYTLLYPLNILSSFSFTTIQSEPDKARRILDLQCLSRTRTRARIGLSAKCVQILTYIYILLALKLQESKRYIGVGLGQGY